ncbi:MgtC/SapB family protein [Streptomyces sp. NPDC051563]|uniref:MgtC/SapB family protein n=1 Tax=unclassified Streptomyces TaxID=2593676 RepID=UPI0037992CBA
MDYRQGDTSTLVTIGHLAVAFVLTYVLGLERTLRGAAAGNRTFSMIGVGAALVAVLALDGAPNALAGVVTGVGFIGGGLVFRQTRTEGDLVHGVTTAGAIFAAAAIGAAAGQGRLALAVAATAFVILALETRHIPGLSFFDGRRWAHRFRSDADVLRLHGERSPSAED